MVRIREARRIARQAQSSIRADGTPADTSAAAQAVQDALLRRSTPAERLARVARLSRMVDALALAGLRSRHPDADDRTMRFLRAELTLGREMAWRVYGEP